MDIRNTSPIQARIEDTATPNNNNKLMQNANLAPNERIIILYAEEPQHPSDDSQNRKNKENKTRKTSTEGKPESQSVPITERCRLVGIGIWELRNRNFEKFAQTSPILSNLEFKKTVLRYQVPDGGVLVDEHRTPVAFEVVVEYSLE